jgi:AraC-like DNA-binding protein
MTVPDWWFGLFKVNRANQGYSLDKVAQIEFGIARNGPVGVPARAEIREITLHGRHFGYLYVLGALLIISWTGFAFWVFKAHAAAVSEEVRNRLQKDLPFVAYQKLSLEPHRDKEKSALLVFLATHYADANLDLETVVSATGMSRNKVNDILKSELGFTFTGYLNKLRMTEAARLLRESDSASVAEVAYSVGYNSTSYFNRLFKEEYQSTPRAFREACQREPKDGAAGTESS